MPTILDAGIYEASGLEVARLKLRLDEMIIKRTDEKSSLSAINARIALDATLEDDKDTIGEIVVARLGRLTKEISASLTTMKAIKGTILQHVDLADSYPDSFTPADKAAYQKVVDDLEAAFPEVAN